MPRKPREKSLSSIYHIMLRGINKQTLFEDIEDRLRFLETLKRYKDISQYLLHGYCLMDNHVHILMKELEETVSQTIKRVSASYVYWYNEKYERSGHLFQERFNSEPVENHAYFTTVLRYIHQNPVKAGLTHHVSECKWTSYQEYIQRTNIVDIDFGLNLFSRDVDKAVPLFTKYMQKRSDDECLDIQARVRISDSCLE